jgi:hypothetical protein
MLLLSVPLLGILETTLWSIFALQLKPVVLIDALQLLMLSAETSISLKRKMFSLAIFYYKHDTSLFVGYQFTQ